MPYKLTAREVADIRGLLADNVRQAEIARRYNVSEATVSLIKNERRWKARDKRHRLEPAEVRTIRELHRSGICQCELARRYGVSQPTIHNILNGKTYTWVT